MPLDTSPAAAALQLEAYRRMGIADRFRIAAELSDLTHAMARAGMRRLHPEWSDDEARAALARALYVSEKRSR